MTSMCGPWPAPMRHVGNSLPHAVAAHAVLFTATTLSSDPPHNVHAQALSDAHAFLFEERQRLLALQAENDELRLQVEGEGHQLGEETTCWYCRPKNTL